MINKTNKNESGAGELDGEGRESREEDLKKQTVCVHIPNPQDDCETQGLQIFTNLKNQAYSICYFLGTFSIDCKTL